MIFNRSRDPMTVGTTLLGDSHPWVAPYSVGQLEPLGDATHVLRVVLLQDDHGCLLRNGNR